jgi:hypothetical protein
VTNLPPPPIKMNLAIKIQMDRKGNLEFMPSILLLFPL